MATNDSALYAQNQEASSDANAIVGSVSGSGSGVVGLSSSGSGITGEGNIGGYFRSARVGAHIVSDAGSPAPPFIAGDAALIIEAHPNRTPHIQMLTEHTTFPTASNGAIITGKNGLGVNAIYAKIGGSWRKLSYTGGAADGAAIF